MTEKQFAVHCWLSRMWDTEAQIEQKINYRDKLNSWGVGQYDAEHVSSRTGENTSESKYLEYTILSEEIEKKIDEYLFQNRRTEDVIAKVSNNLYRNILFDWYINHDKWNEICKSYNYGKSQLYKIRQKALDAVAPYVPKGEATDDNKFVSLNYYKSAE